MILQHLQGSGNVLKQAGRGAGAQIPQMQQMPMNSLSGGVGMGNANLGANMNLANNVLGNMGVGAGGDGFGGGVNMGGVGNKMPHMPTMPLAQPQQQHQQPPQDMNQLPMQVCFHPPWRLSCVY